MVLIFGGTVHSGSWVVSYTAEKEGPSLWSHSPPEPSAGLTPETGIQDLFPVYFKYNTLIVQLVFCLEKKALINSLI